MSKLSNIFCILGLPGFRAKIKIPPFSIGESSSSRDTLLEIFVEECKHVVVEKYEFAKIGKNFDNNCSIFDRSGIGSIRKI